jgi:hypothetical protein
MHTNYHDILALTDKDPLWFDECAVPRFLPFEPSLLSNIYVSQAVLLEIRCQACGHPFLVALSWRDFDLRSARATGEPLLDSLAYGDPPNIGCCSSGPSMTSESVRIVEYWVRKDYQWTQCSVEDL